MSSVTIPEYKPTPIKKRTPVVSASTKFKCTDSAQTKIHKSNGGSLAICKPPPVYYPFASNTPTKQTPYNTTDEKKQSSNNMQLQLLDIKRLEEEIESDEDVGEENLLELFGISETQVAETLVVPQVNHMRIHTQTLSQRHTYKCVHTHITRPDHYTCTFMLTRNLLVHKLT